MCVFVCVCVCLCLILIERGRGEKETGTMGNRSPPSLLSSKLLSCITFTDHKDHVPECCTVTCHPVIVVCLGLLTKWDCSGWRSRIYTHHWDWPGSCYIIHCHAKYVSGDVAAAIFEQLMHGKAWFGQAHAPRTAPCFSSGPIMHCQLASPSPASINITPWMSKLLSEWEDTFKSCTSIFSIFLHASNNKSSFSEDKFLYVLGEVTCAQVVVVEVVRACSWTTREHDCSV